VTVADLFSRLALIHEHRALHDPLTGLANREGFGTAVERALGRGRARPGAAVLFIDVDDFKAINDSLGHSAGDELIGTLAARLRDAFRNSDVVGRLGGDEFAVLLADSDEQTARRAAERVRTLLAHPVILADRVVHMGASVGITMQEGPEHDVESLLRNADLAMYDAKRAGKARHAVFRPALYEPRSPSSS
jgi:diguanylate cyclase (GGDEF)-like protein